MTDALRMAWFRRHPEPGLNFHSDRGSQYCSGKFQDALSSYGMRSSMSRKGDCWDTAPTESLWGRLKVGGLYGRRFATQREAMDEVIDSPVLKLHRVDVLLGHVEQQRRGVGFHLYGDDVDLVRVLHGVAQRAHGGFRAVDGNEHLVHRG